MQNIIVTVRNQKGTFQFDMEIPTDLKGDKMADDIMEAMNGINPEFNYTPTYFGVYLNRIGRFLSDEETMAEAGVWNGDYLTIMFKDM